MKRPRNINEGELFHDVVWADPKPDVEQFQLGQRGTFVLLSAAAVDEFVRTNGLETRSKATGRNSQSPIMRSAPICGLGHRLPDSCGGLTHFIRSDDSDSCILLTTIRSRVSHNCALRSTIQRHDH
jgi:hypothetical protein